MDNPKTIDGHEDFNYGVFTADDQLIALTADENVAHAFKALDETLTVKTCNDEFYFDFRTEIYSCVSL